MKLSDALDARKHKVMSLVGAGGKTTTMFALAGELVAEGRTIITTTTTRIAMPLPSQSPHLMIQRDETTLWEEIHRSIPMHQHSTVASEVIGGGKLKGISTDLVDKLAEVKGISHIIIEADGSAQKPLKAPNSTEPVIPDTSSLVVIVIGYDSIGKELTDAHVFRAEIAARLLNVPAGSIVNREMTATLVTHPQGLVKGIPGNAAIVCLVNKVAAEEEHQEAKELAWRILAENNRRIEKVVLGNVQSSRPVIEVITRAKE